MYICVGHVCGIEACVGGGVYEHACAFVEAGGRHCYPVQSLYLIPLRQGLSLELEPGWQFENPSGPPVSACLVLPRVLVLR